jgi:hypothetical protein
MTIHVIDCHVGIGKTSCNNTEVLYQGDVIVHDCNWKKIVFNVFPDEKTTGTDSQLVMIIPVINDGIISPVKIQTAGTAELFKKTC